MGHEKKKLEKPDFESLFTRFRTSGTMTGVVAAGTGLIHGTWIIKTKEAEEPDFVVQRINDHVFPCVPEMMDNIKKVTDHIKRKHPGDERRVLEVVLTRDDQSYLIDPEGNYWRMFKKIDPGICHDKVTSANIACEAGRAFGQFIADLTDFPTEELFPVLPDFHSIEVRFDQLQQAVQNDPYGRVNELKEEIDFVHDRIERMMRIPELQKKGELPVRVTHNDTKLNNILFDDHEKAVCVIDLDTVMPGLTLYDFGDTIRTAANTAAEDEKNPDVIQFNISVFEAYTEGFLASTGSFLTPSELDNLSLASQYMTFIMGVRFLTDYISGDIYYNTQYEGQNLYRCRAQFQLVKRMMEVYPQCQEIVTRIAQKSKEKI